MRSTQSPAILIALVLTIMLTACAPSAPATPTPVTVDPDWVETERYAVYEAVIRSEYGSPNVVLRPSTTQVRVLDANIDRLQERIPALQRSTVLNYNRNNQDIVTIEDRFSDDLTVTLLGKTDFEAYFADPASPDPTEWSDFCGEYSSTGYLELSQAGFSDDGLQALIYYTFAGCSSDCVKQLLFLEKQDGAWQVVERQVDSQC